MDWDVPNMVAQAIIAEAMKVRGKTLPLSFARLFTLTQQYWKCTLCVV